MIGEAGDVDLSVAESVRLQRIVLGDSRFVRLANRAREKGFEMLTPEETEAVENLWMEVLSRVRMVIV